MMSGTQHKSLKNNIPAHLFITTALFWFTQYAFAPYINPELERMGASATLMGLCGTLYGVMQLIARVPFGYFSARMGRQKIFVVIGCMLSFISCVGMYIFYTPAGILFFRAITGIASGTWVCFTVLYGSYYSRAESSRHISLLDMGGHLGKLICYLIALQIVALFDCRAALVLGMVSGILALLMTRTVEEKRLKPQKIRFSDIKHVGKNRHLLVCSLLASIAQFIQCGTYLSFTQNLATRIAASNAQLTWLNIFLFVPTVLLNLFANKVLVPKIGAKNAIILGFGMGVMYCVLAPLCTSMTALYACQTLGAGNTSVALAVLLGQSMREIAPKLRPIAMTLFQILFSIGLSMGPLFMGVVVDMSSLNIGFFVMAGIAAAAILLTKVLYSENTREECA